METLDVFDKAFSTDKPCKEYLVAKRWPDGVRCPRCNRKEKVYALKACPFHWTCKNEDCGKRQGYRFSVITRTIFQDTKIPLRLWFKVGYLMLNAKKGISSLQVHRAIFGEDSGSDWRTSWYMCHRWRAAMAGNMFKPLGGIVEVDETYIGGKDRNRHKNNKSRTARELDALTRTVPAYRPNEAVGYKKVGVIGAIERKGNVVAKVIGDMGARTKAGFVDEVVSEKVDLVVSDENPAYRYIGHNHEAVNHSRGEYVRGNIHTANIDSFWSLLKRGVVGTYHKVSKDYLPLYLNEFSYRFNNRKNPDIFGDLIATCAQ